MVYNMMLVYAKCIVNLLGALVESSEKAQLLGAIHFKQHTLYILVGLLTTANVSISKCLLDLIGCIAVTHNGNQHIKIKLVNLI